MTAAIVSRPSLDPSWPKGAVYHSPRGLYPFQEEGVVSAYMLRQSLVVFDTGTGKTHIAMRLAALRWEDADNDLFMVVCEKNKVDEWYDDILTFTTLVPYKHLGSGRMGRFDKGGFDVLITTYETAKADLASPKRVPGKRGLTLTEGPLFERLNGKRVDVVYDEVTKLKNRKSGNYKAHEFWLKEAIKTYPEQIRVGLTATPIEKDWEDSYNICRLLSPWRMPNVTEWTKRYVRSVDPYGRNTYRADRMHEFAASVQEMMIRKRKTDPDVIEQFPKKVEESIHVQMGPEQDALYAAIEDIGADFDEPVPGLWMIKRLVANHPAAVVNTARKGESMLAKMLVEEWGEETFLDCPSAKTERWLERIVPIVKDQGSKVVVFTFFGQAVLPLLRDALEAKGVTVYSNHGSMSLGASTESRRAFRADPQPCVFLTSDAGSRGINLPEATYVDEYESALTYANRTQRLDRIHRIDSMSPSVTCTTYIVDHTVEVDIMNMVIARNEFSDILLGDEDAGEDFLNAADRRERLGLHHLKRKKKR